MDTLKIKAPQWLDAIPIQLREGVTAEKGKKYSFKATVLVWDPEMDKEWSVISRNGVRYNRQAALEEFQTAIDQNKGIPVMYNHIIDEDDADQLGIITKISDSDEGMVVEGFLNGHKKRVLEEIIPGFLNNVSLQVDGERETIEEGDKDVTYATPTDVYEVSFVPVNGIVGANNLELALAEKVKLANQKLAEKISECDVKLKEISKSDIEDELDGIDESFDMTEDKYEEMYQEALKEHTFDYGKAMEEALKEVYETTPTMDEVQVGQEDMQLAKGIKVEQEHESTYNWLAGEIAQGNGLPPKESFFAMIAKEHIEEDPRYYDKLEVVEDVNNN